MIDDFSVFKEELKSRIDIVDVVQEFVELKKRGSNHVGLCPFHTEKTPSFSVNQTGQFYHCFGCGKGGDVIGFLMDITGMSFMEAVEQLSERVGLEVPKSNRPDASAKDRKEHLALANIAAADYFHRTLSAKEGKAAMDYLLGRGLAPETIRTFRLGYAPEDAAGLIEFAKQKHVNLSDLEAAGIISSNRYGGPPYSRFGGRVIFPIIDQTKRVIGFGGRLLEGEGAKYINSPETLIYRKSAVLFGIHQAKDAIKRSRKAIVVEGYMDVISLHQAGITNVIAASGTAFTVEQGRMIARMAREATLLFDGDRAGLSAAARGADNLLATELVIKVVVLPEGHDPDTFVKDRGPDGMNALLDSPVDIWEFKLQVLSGESASVQDRIKLAGEVADSISLMPDDMKRDVYIRDMAARIGVDVNSMHKAVYGRIRRRTYRKQTETPSQKPVGAPNERELIGYIIAFPGLARHFMEEAGAKPFSNPVIKKVAEEVFHRLVEGLDVTPAALMSALDDKSAQELVARVAMMDLDEATASRHIEDNIKRYRKSEIDEEITALNRRIDVEKDIERKKHLVEQRDQLSRLKRLDNNAKNGK